MKVRKLMSTRVQTISCDATLREVQEIFTHSRFHHLVVTDADRPVGVISDRDLFRHISPFVGNRVMERPQDQRTLDRHVHQIMTRELIVIDTESTITEAFHLMHSRDVSCLPVMDPRNRLVGILTWKDLARALVELEQSAHP